MSMATVPGNQATAEASPNGNGKHGEHGRPGEIVFLATDMDLAPEMRKLKFRATCAIKETSLRRVTLERKSVVVAYSGKDNRAQAITQAKAAVTTDLAERAGILDWDGAFGFSGKPDDFVDWYEDAIAMDRFEHGGDFLRLAEERSEQWLSKGDVAGGDHSDEVRDPIGDVDPCAFHGPLGRIALKTQSETEANPLFVLAHLMAFFGAIVGRQAHFVVSGTMHRLNLFVGIIGLSGSSRKGMAGDVALAIFQRVDALFEQENITDGLNSGAGLLQNLRDKTFKITDDGPVTIDEGVSDKRRVFLESELAAVLKQGHRDSDPMTEHLRKFWDGKEVVNSNVRKDPLKVTGAHVALVGHCTPADLESHLTEGDKRNGTANRFIWLFGTRSKVLPRGGNVFSLLDFLTDDLDAIVNVIQFAQSVKEIVRTSAAEKRWEELYRQFDDVPVGMLGAFFVRAAPQVMRMAAIFALADRKTMIDVQHIEAALAIWEHSSRSLRFMFPDDADPAADKLMAALRSAGDPGLSKREITNDVFRKNKDADELDKLLNKLLAYRLISQFTPIQKGRGRAGHRYRMNRWEMKP